MGGRIANNVYGYGTGQVEYFEGQFVLTALEGEDKCHTVIIYVMSATCASTNYLKFGCDIVILSICMIDFSPFY